MRRMLVVSIPDYVIHTELAKSICTTSSQWRSCISYLPSVASNQPMSASRRQKHTCIDASACMDMRVNHMHTQFTHLLNTSPTAALMSIVTSIS